MEENREYEYPEITEENFEQFADNIEKDMESINYNIPLKFLIMIWLLQKKHEIMLKIQVKIFLAKEKFKRIILRGKYDGTRNIR